MDTAPFYLDWKFWSALIAFAALVLSQLPPLHQLLRRGRLVGELYSRIVVHQKIGNPNLNVNVILRNTGPREVTVREIRCRLKRDGADLGVLTGMTYLRQPSDTTQVLLTSFILQPRQEWSHFVQFHREFSRLEEKAVKVATAALRASIIGKVVPGDETKKLIEADPEIVKPIEMFFDKKFVWFPGEYEVVVAVTAVDAKSLEIPARFTLFESDTNELLEARDALKHGDGVYWDRESPITVTVQIAAL